jgi:arsenate reductase
MEPAEMFISPELRYGPNMPQSVTIYHNPRCSKSRQTLELLREQGIEPVVVEYLKDPPTERRVEELISLLKIEPHAILRSKEAPYAEHGLSKKSSVKAVAKAIAQSPVLLERPIVVKGKKAAIGRPPENVLEIL